MKQKCFFAYCSEDYSNIKNLMDYIKEQVEKKSNGRIQIYLDTNSSNTGENFKENEKKILKSDSVVIFFSPNYKRIIDRNIIERGAWREYNLILSAKEKNIAVIPIIVDGKVPEAITKDFKDNIAADFSRTLPIVAGKRGNKLNTEYKTEMTKLISSIIYETSVAHRRKDYHFSTREEAYTVLFCNTDSRNKLPRGCMYKSEAYKNIMSEEGSSFLVGRKGSGKTTFFEVLEKYDPMEFDKHFKVLRPISVEDIREEHIYSVLYSFSQDHKIFGYDRIIGLFWEIYLNMCAIYIVCIEEENFRIRDERQLVFHKIANKLKKLFNVSKLDSGNVKFAIFTESITAWENFLKTEIFKYATEDAFLASMDANFNVDNVLMKLFGTVLYRQFIKAIERCEKRILIALDKFDAISDRFRWQVKNDLQSQDAQLIEAAKKRAEFDKVLYHSLVQTVEKLKSIDVGTIGNATFCIIIPQDRVDQIRLVDRDFAKKNFISLAWDAIELLEVILLRLKVLYNFEYDQRENPIEKFNYVMKKYMPTIPQIIKIETGGSQKEINLFQYLLRISFWRPRDIIKYLAVLYDANEKNIQKYNQIDMVTLKNLLNKVTEDIIEDEFYNEYDKIFYNLADFMDSFQEETVILSTTDIIERVQKFKFQGVLFNDSTTILEKLNLLYEMGIIGLQFDSDYIKTNHIGNTLCFVFNEGMFPFCRTKSDIIKGSNDINIVINPIFSKKLSLRYNTTEIVGNYSWEYLMQNHMRRMGIKRI